MMSRLKHPQIVQMKWACIQTLSFAMEFSPEGDLSTVLEKKLKEFQLRHVGCPDIRDTILDRWLTYKMVVEVRSKINHSYQAYDHLTANILV